MFDVLSQKAKDIIIEKKDNSFAIQQFLIGGCTPYRLDKNCFGGRIMTYVLEDLSSKYLSLIIFLLIYLKRL